jgi:hypothetical protein
LLRLFGRVDLTNPNHGVHIVWVDVRHMLPMLLLLLLMLFSAPPSAPFFHFWIRQCHLQDGSFS